MTPVTIQTTTREITLPDYGLDPARNARLIRNLAQLPAELRDDILGGTK